MSISNNKSKTIEGFIAILIVAILIIGGYLLFYGLLRNSGDYVDWIEYNASYDGQLDLDIIENKLLTYNITCSRFHIAPPGGDNLSWNELQFHFGNNFTGINLSDAKCVIAVDENPPGADYNSLVNIRIYGADTRNGKLDSFKPAYEESMDYIIEIIHDATGKCPVSYNYYYEDGAPFDLPEDMIDSNPNVNNTNQTSDYLNFTGNFASLSYTNGFSRSSSRFIVFENGTYYFICHTDSNSWVNITSDYTNITEEEYKGLFEYMSINSKNITITHSQTGVISDDELITQMFSNQSLIDSFLSLNSSYNHNTMIADASNYIIQININGDEHKVSIYCPEFGLLESFDEYYSLLVKYYPPR